MVLKSFAKINLSLSVNRKLKNNYHDIQSLYCLIDIFDKIYIKKIKSNKDKINFTGPFSKGIKKKNNSITKLLKILRKKKLISNFYDIRVFKQIPVFAGLGGGTSNAVTILKFLLNKEIKLKLLNEIIDKVGSDMRLFFYKQGIMQNLKTVSKIM